MYDLALSHAICWAWGGGASAQESPPVIYPDDSVHEALKKCGQEALCLAKAWVKSAGKYDKDFCAEYIRATAFLLTPPKVDKLPLPAWTMQRHVTFQVEELSSGHL